MSSYEFDGPAYDAYLDRLSQQGADDVDDGEILDRLREVLEQGNWIHDSGGFTMTGGFWLDADLFHVLFPEWPATHPHVDPPNTGGR